MTATGRRAALWLLMWALLSAQLLGVVHSVVHAPALAGGASVSTVAQHQHDTVSAMFGGHDDDGTTCRLFDQLGCADVVLVVPGLALPLALTPVLLQVFQGDFVARWAALFDARGPPSAR